jgi:hypothetical protein
VVRFAAGAQQPAALNDVIEATTSEFGTKPTRHDVRLESVMRSRADIVGVEPVVSDRLVHRMDLRRRHSRHAHATLSRDAFRPYASL